MLGSASPASIGLAEADAVYTGVAASDWAGCSVSGAGDVDGDGHADLLVGACGVDDAGDGSGAVYLVLGSSSPTSASLADIAVEYIGEAAINYAGWSAPGAGDVDGDGYDDVLVGAPDNSDAGEAAGAAYLVLGSASPASARLADADAEYTGEAANDLAGYSVSGAGDVDGDGMADLLIGAPYVYGGFAYLLLAPGP